MIAFTGEADDQETAPGSQQPGDSVSSRLARARRGGTASVRGIAQKLNVE